LKKGFTQYEDVIESNLVDTWDYLLTIAMTGVAANTKGILTDAESRESLKYALGKKPKEGGQVFDDYYDYTILRTREIGIRLAVGAKEKEILIQFLVEAVLLSLIGGLIGVIVGISGSMIVSSIIKWPAVISPLSIIVAFFFAAVVGIFFGIYPARKASQLDPIEALRYE